MHPLRLFSTVDVGTQLAAYKCIPIKWVEIHHCTAREVESCGAGGCGGGGGTLDDMFHNQNASNSPHENMLQMENRATGARIIEGYG